MAYVSPVETASAGASEPPVEPTFDELAFQPLLDASSLEPALDHSPLDDSEENFRIRDRFEVAAILREKARDGTLLTVAFGDDERDAYLSVIVDVRPEAGWFAIDAPAAWSQRRRVLAAPRVHCSFDLHRILHRMTAPAPREHDAGSTIALSLPGHILRFQRREFFRIDIPRAAPVRCRFPSGAGEFDRPIEVRVLDISLGGIGTRLHSPHPRLETGMLIPGVAIELPEFGEINAALEVRNTLDIPLGPSRHETRCGFRFVCLHPPCQIMVQRYVNRLQARRLITGTG